MGKKKGSGKKKGGGKSKLSPEEQQALAEQEVGYALIHAKLFGLHSCKTVWFA